MITLASAFDSLSLGLALLPLLLSLCFIIGGFYILRGNAFWTALWSNVNWEHLLYAWHISLEKDDAPTILKDVKLYWCVVRSYALIGAGTFMLVPISVLIGVSIALPGLSFVQNMVGVGLFWVPCMFTLLAGYMLGYAWGIEQMRRSRSSRIMYADVRQRRSSDYCSLIVRYIPLIFIAYNIIIAALVEPYLNAMLSIPLGERQLTLVKSPLVVSIIPALMILTVIIVELLLIRVSSFPRVVASSDTVVAQRIDDMIRSVSIGQLLSFEFLILGVLMLAQFSLLLPDPGVPTYVSVIQLLGWFITGGLYIVGSMLGVCRGQVGGRVSGWWWQTEDSIA